MESQKIYVGDGASGEGMNGMTAAAMMNGGMNNWMNNPFAYLMFMPFMASFANGGWGNGNNRGMGVGQGLADVNLSNQIQSLAGQVSDNHNSDLTMQSINGVGGAVKDNGVALNAGFDTVNSGICGVKTGIIEQGYQNQLANCQQTNTILQQSQALNNTVQNGFTQLGFQIERNACDVKETSTANTQKIVDTLNNHWSTEAAATITQLRDELATLRQTQTLVAALSGTAAATKTSATS